jgi:[acyl-carrier-protein] S-malonyltransferase
MVVLIHSGQGSQQLNMFDGFSSEIFKQTVEEASDILNIDVYKIVNGSSLEELSLTENTQICVTVMNYAIDKLWRQNNGPVNYRVGHSLGEYSAFCSSESFNFADLLKLVQYRAKIMSSAIPPFKGRMLSVNQFKKEDLIKIVDTFEDIEITCYNSPVNHVISGSIESLSNFKDYLDSLKINNNFLNISVPCHSKYLTPCTNLLKTYMQENVKVKIPTTPVISETSICNTTDEIIDHLSYQISSPVNWVDTLTTLVNKKVNRFIVFGTKAGNYHNMIRSTFPEFKSFVVHDDNSLERVLTAIQ